MAVTDEAITKIKQMIVSGELRPGDRLPREKELSDRLGLSRNSLREAIKALSVIRILDVRQGDGTYVTSLAPPLLLEALSFVVDFHEDATVLELLEVRRILEPAATAMACSHIDDAGIERLYEILNEVSEDTTVEDLVANDLELHRRIATASGNDYLASLLDSLAGSTARARIWRGLTETQAVSRTLAEHQAIVDAIVARQPDLARSWATVHVSGVEQWLRHLL
jgi:GntR family transcriptional regulator, transcriptional repressor for pyruvate dehydrogenase complex